MEPEPQLARRTERQSLSHHESGLAWALIILVLILMAFAVTIFSGSSTAVPVPGTPEPTAAEPRQSRIYTVSYKAGVFSPTNLRIHAGDTVKFRNDGILPIHVSSEEYVGFDSVGDVPPGSDFAFTFAAKGTYGYINVRNREEAGTIIVR